MKPLRAWVPRVVIVLTLCWGMSGCIVVRGEQLKSPPEWPLDKRIDAKSVRLTVSGRVLSSGDIHPIQPHVERLLEGKAQQAYLESGLFNRVTVSTESYDLEAEVQVVEERHGVWLASLIARTSAGVLPSYHQSMLTSVTVFRDRSGAEIAVIEKSESVSFWVQIFLVVAMPFRDDSKVTLQQIVYDLNRATLVEARLRGVF